jgi:hypothetical protein
MLNGAGPEGVIRERDSYGNSINPHIPTTEQPGGSSRTSPWVCVAPTPGPSFVPRRGALPRLSRHSARRTPPRVYAFSQTTGIVAAKRPTTEIGERAVP